VDRPINAASHDQLRIRRVNDGIDALLSNVALNKLNMARSELEFHRNSQYCNRPRLAANVS
jgi:hypothetical protein